MPAWTEDRVEILKKMWKEKSTAGQIAEVLGNTTRNAVIGKIHRMGLSRTRKKPREEPKLEANVELPEPADEDLALSDLSAEPTVEAPAAADEVSEDQPTTPEETVEAAEAAEESAVEAEDTPLEPEEESIVEEVEDTPEARVRKAEESALKLGLLELTERTCKWPYGDPATKDFWFCGLPSKVGQPYCEAHISLAFQPFASRRESRSS